MARLVILFLLASAPVGGGQKSAEPVYEIKLKKPADSVAVQKDKDRTVFVVTSPSGIGEVVLTLKAGQWPGRVALRLQYENGRDFGSLEGFTLGTDCILVQGSLRESGKMPFGFLDPQGKPEAISNLAEASAGHLDVRVERHDNFLEITLPANLLSGASRLRLGWIDAYRN